MADDIITQEDPIIARKRALIAEGAARNPPVKLDMRFAVDRMEDALGLKGEPLTAAKPAPTPPAPDPAILAELEELRKLKARVEQAAVAPPPAQPYNVPGGTLTTMQLSGTGALLKEEEERRLLMEQCTRLGIAHTVSPKAGLDAIRTHINNHVAAKAQMQAVLDEQDRRAAKAPPKTLVKMRVLPLGDGKISKGIHIPGMGDAKYSRGDIIDDVLLDTAKQHERSGMGEIVGA